MSTTQASILMLAVLAMAALAVSVGLSSSSAFGRARVRATQLAARLCGAIAGVVGVRWTFILVILAGVAATVSILWPLGAAASRLQPWVDAPGFGWLTQWNEADSGWAALNETLTQLGDPLPSLAAVVAGSALMAAAWRTRRWLPPLVLVTALAMEWFAQRVIGAVVARGYPPGGTGTWPSGGTARVLVIYGLIVVLACIRWPRLGRPWRTAAWAVVALLTVAEAYSRLYLLKHWPSDVPAGMLFGVLLLVTSGIGIIALIGPKTDERDTATEAA